MADSDLTKTAFIYKRRYSDKQVGDMAERDHPFMRMLTKHGGFTGSAFFYDIRTGNPQGIAKTVSGAQDSASGSNGKQLQADRKKKFGVITLDGEAMAAAEGDDAAFLSLVRMETEGIIEEHGDGLAFELYRDGQNVRGARASISSDTVTLAVADDARNFKEDMVVVAGPNEDGTSLRSGDATVTAVDEDAGTVTLDDQSTITSFADDDFLFRKGDVGGGIEGLAAHLPLSAPTSGDSFRGIDRSSNPRRLAGVRVDDTSTPIEENAGLVAVKISQVGKKTQRAGRLLLNPINFWTVAKRLNAKVEYDGGGGTAGYAFESFDIHSPAGTLRAISDPDCPTNRGYVLKMDTWYVKTLRQFIHIIRDDGRPTLRKTDEDSIETRTRSMANLCCSLPGANGLFSI